MGARTSRHGPRSGALAALATLLGLLLAACGGGNSWSSSATSTGGSAVLPGLGKPPLTLGTKAFVEEDILGELYKQTLEAKGYTVNYKPNIGATEVIDKALTSGQIDAYPEYTGESVATVARLSTIVSTAPREYNLAAAFYAKRGQAVSSMTPFSDTDAIVVSNAFAKRHRLTMIADLKKLRHFTLGAESAFLSRQEGAAGMRSKYGLTNFTLKPLALGLQYQALDVGDIAAADAFTTDPQLASGKYRLLTDPKNIFGFQNIIVVIDKSKLAQLGGQTFMNLIDKVNALLTTPAMTAMNKAVAVDKQSPGAVARAFLKANGVI